MAPVQQGASVSGELGGWLRTARAGSAEALGQVLQSCRHYLLLIANRELGPDLQAKFGPSDVVQESLLEAQRDFGRFKGDNEAEILAWLRRILLNNLANLRDRYRQTGKRDLSREVPLDCLSAHERDFEDLAAHEQSPVKQAIGRERDAILEQSLAQLPEHYREALRLRHQENCTFEEIGTRTGRSKEAARKIWARAVELLKEIWNTQHESA